MKRSYKNAFACAAVLACGLSTSVFATEPNETEFTVQVNPYLNVTLSDSTLSLPITPTSNGTFGSTSFTALASTNHIYGYKLNVSFKDSTNTSNTDLVSNVINVNTNAHPTIPTFTTDDVLTSNAFSTSTNANHLNHWAISYGDNLHYKKAEDGTIATSNGPVIDDDTDVYLGTKLDLLTSPGSYSTTMIFEVVGNPAPSAPDNNPINQAMGDANKTLEVINGKQYYKMQDMTTAICNSITTPTASDFSDTPETQLVDIRDGKLYWVAKLMDGNCWMTQNLDLDLVHMENDEDALYTHSNTDLGWGSDPTTTSWNPTRSTISRSDISNAGAISNWSDDYNSPYSVDVGDWYRTDVWYEESTTYNYLKGEVGDPARFRNRPYSNNGAHGHLGNYYNFSAAVASNNTSSYSTSTYDNPANNPQNSICPAGWRLPVSTTYTTGQLGDSDFYNLIYEYNNGTNTDEYMSAAPLWLTRGGNIDGGNLWNSGRYGTFWSSTVGGWSYAYFLDVGPSSLYPNNYSMRSYALPVRCIAR